MTPAESLLSKLKAMQASEQYDAATVSEAISFVGGIAQQFGPDSTEQILEGDNA